MKSLHRPSPESRVCPWWVIHAFDNPVRRLFQNPDTILQGLIRPGDKCLDLGCGYGYFTIPMARLAGPSGGVVAADLQPEMLAGLKRRAERSGVLPRIRLHQVDAAALQFPGAFQFVLAFWMVHEVPDQGALLRQIRLSLAPAGRFLMVEPKGHVSRAAFARTVGTAVEAGFTRIAEPTISFSRAVLMTSGEGTA